MSKKTEHLPVRKHKETILGKMSVRMVLIFVGTLIAATCVIILISFALTKSVNLKELSSFEIKIEGQSELVNALITLAVFVGITIVIGTIFISIYLRNIKALKNAMRQVASGNFDVKLKVDPHTEEGGLCSDFNKMADDLKRLESFKEEFIVNASHEFKTPLSTIRGYANLIAQGGLTEEEEKQYALCIDNEAEKLSKLTGNILKLSKLETQDIVFEMKTFDVAENIREAILSLQNQWEQKEIELDIDMQEGIEIVANEELLYQVWYNILDNAIKFSPEKSVIKVRAKEDDGKLKVCIRDNGPGMDEDTQKHLFDKFYQGDTSHHDEGNGLGLALVKKIVDFSEGHVWVESAIMAGAAFYVTLPLIEK